MPASPTKRSLDYMRKQGFTCQVVERWNPFARVRQDLFGFCDIVAMSPTEGIIAVQSTSASNVSSHIKKMNNEPRVFTWIAAGGRVVIHGWRGKVLKSIPFPLVLKQDNL